ncbi:serine hydrolase [Lentilactobacillus buchneri]|uniref:serine hydrolase n=1 Tax=Lentilactobacillus buchneri TaxID=1581 RepID=UPI0021A3AA21|nr:serine hydrolase [Lentilactobacillus buchneri]MCT2898663.1 serine hydrolase [Lentilactobacillus buchneri]
MSELSETIERVMADSSFKYGLLIQSNGQTLVDHDSHEAFPSASLIKLAILNDVLDSNVDLDQSVDVSTDELVGGAGILQLMSVRPWKLRDLLALMISVSDNSATNVVISLMGMNHIQHYLQTHDFHETGLERYLMDGRALASGKNNYTSAAESLRLLQQALHNVSEVQSWFANQQFRYKLPGNFDESGENVAVYNKTGEGNLIDHDVAQIVYNNHSVDIAMLTAGSLNRMETIQKFNQVGQSVVDWLA